MMLGGLFYRRNYKAKKVQKAHSGFEIQNRRLGMNLLLSKLKSNVFDTILWEKQNTTDFLKENLRGQKFCFEIMNK